jgi:Zn-dependent protease with chaperone function
MRPARRPVSPADYRYPYEHGILAITILLALVVIAVTATATLCGSFVFVLLMVASAYYTTRRQHNHLIERAHRISEQTEPGLNALVQVGLQQLGPGPVDVFVLPSRVLNAYTFGLNSPKVVILNSALLRALDGDELCFVISHELGHVRLGHTRLNSLIGGMSGIPSPPAAFAMLQLAFLWWNRACEHSADRAGLLACQNPAKAVSALVKLSTGGLGLTPAELEHVLSQADKAFNPIEEALATHPRMVRRIAELRRFAASRRYQHLVAA